MLEIYKENLFDLLQVGKTDLKIKENPSKGIYVQNLTQFSIASETDMIDVINIGYST